MGSRDFRRRAVVADAIRRAATAYFELEGIVDALEGMPAVARDRALDEVVSGMIDRIDGAPTNTLLSDQMKLSAMRYLMESGLGFRADALAKGMV